MASWITSLLSTPQSPRLRTETRVLGSSSGSNSSAASTNNTASTNSTDNTDRAASTTSIPTATQQEQQQQQQVREQRAGFLDNLGSGRGKKRVNKKP